MKPITEWTQDDLHGFIGQRESSTLEFKQLASLMNTDRCRNELAKDVSAMANSGGGLIIYGIIEKDQIAVDFDLEPEPMPHLTEDWIGNVLTSKISPRLADYTIKAIPVSDEGRVLYVLDIPQAKSLGPHQSADQKYYKRSDARNIPMMDYEIRDVMRRTTTPILQLEPFLILSKHDMRTALAFNVINTSQTPAFYVDVSITIDLSAQPLQRQGRDWKEEDTTYFQEPFSGLAKRYYRSFVCPPAMPFYNENPVEIFRLETMIHVGATHVIETKISCPGFGEIRRGLITRTEYPTVNWKQIITT